MNQEYFDFIPDIDIDHLLSEFNNNNDSCNYENEHDRLKSFATFWIITDVPKEKLACAGFYHVKEDHVKCFACNVIIGNWGLGDDPFIEHFKHSTKCPFIKGEQTDNIPINEEILRKELKELNLHNLEVNQSTKVINNTVSKQQIHHPCYKTVEKRFNTFVNWPRGLNQSPKELSRAGFFYLGTSDEVKCFSCGKCLKGWEKDDKPDEEHKRHFWDSCLFIRQYYKELENKSNHKSSAKASTQQISHLVEYMNGEPDFANGVINISNDRNKFHSMWNDLTDHLNGMGPAYKPAKLWREVWRNVKYNRKKGVKRSYSYQSVESCKSNSSEISGFQSNSDNNFVPKLLLNSTINAVQNYFNISNMEQKKRKLERELNDTKLE